MLPLPITNQHAVKVFDLPPYHGDPFDRLIIAQAITEDLVLMTADRDFQKYPVKIFWSGKQHLR